MSGTDRVYMGLPQSNERETTHFRAKAVVKSPLISTGIRIGTAGTTNAVDVPPGAIVYRVGLWNAGTAIAGATLSVGVVGVIDKFLGVVSTIAAADIVFSGLAGGVNADPVGGAYFASGGTIQLGVAALGIADSTVKILVWYTGTN
uniref:Uncharacterized protein n=1 Tax=viral metagenome TaxID=1070528 RepID=A0A6M3IUN4_9ZZZZ